MVALEVTLEHRFLNAAVVLIDIDTRCVKATASQARDDAHVCGIGLNRALALICQLHNQSSYRGETDMLALTMEAVQHPFTKEPILRALV